MAGNINNVIHATHDPEVAVFIFAGTVAGEIHARDLRPVLLHIAVGIAVNGTQHSWPGLLENQESTRASRDWFALHSYNLGHNAWKRFGAGSRLSRNSAGNGRNHDVAGFGLPPGIN